MAAAADAHDKVGTADAHDTVGAADTHGMAAAADAHGMAAAAGAHGMAAAADAHDKVGTADAHGMVAAAGAHDGGTHLRAVLDIRLAVVPCGVPLALARIHQLERRFGEDVHLAGLHKRKHAVRVL